MGKIIKDREPLTEQEILNYLNTKVEATEKQWGKDYIYSEWAREDRDDKISKYRNGEVIEVYVEHYVDSYGNGSGDYEDILYSDGHVETACYGYLD